MQVKSWKEIKDSLAGSKAGVINKAALDGLHYTQLCALCYDEDTPKEVVKALSYHFDASVRAAARQRPDVLSGHILNPFKLQQPPKKEN